jgi:hypothetical protein
MTSVQRFLGVLFGIVLLATWAAEASRYADRSPFTPYVTQAPPQRADGDFDGDGRIDTAFIQDRAGRSHISIRLTSSSSSVDLDPTVIGVVEGDVDHDGDLDLVAATQSGELLVLINDGHGHFTRQAAARKSALSGEAELIRTAADESFAVDVRVGSLPPSREATTPLSRAPARPRQSPRATDAPSTTLPLLRAPPEQSL